MWPGYELKSKATSSRARLRAQEQGSEPKSKAPYHEGEGGEERERGGKRGEGGGGELGGGCLDYRLYAIDNYSI